MFHNVRRFIAALSLVPLAGCSLGNFIADESIDYNATVENVTDDLLVTNILRARDQAPLIFSDLSQIRGSIQLNLSAQNTFPWGPSERPVSGTGVRRISQIGPITLQNNPTFDIAPLNTKQFSQGILEPLNKNILIYYLNRNAPANLVLHLLVSQIDKVSIENSKTTNLETVYYYQTDKFNPLIDKWAPPHDRDGPRIILKNDPVDYGPKVVADAKTIIAAAAAGLEAKPPGKQKDFSGAQVQFAKKSPHVTICAREPGTDYIYPIVIATNSILKTPEAEQTPKVGDCPAPPAVGKTKPPLIAYKIHLRSVEEIFYFLGYFQNKDVGWPPLPFFIYNEPISDARFSVEYRGHRYYVAELRAHQGKDNNNNTLYYYDDATITVLAMLNDLLNLNRDANEIPTTKAVQSVGGGG